MTKSSGNIPTGRTQSVRVKTAKRRTVSSARWLERQLNDPYVVEAKKRGLRSRAAFKLLQLDEKFGLLKRGQRIVDLGAAPGGWTQVAVEKSKSDKGGTGLVVGLDLLEMDPVPGATTFQMDFTSDEAPVKLKSLLNGPADIVMSDMAANTTGHTQTDHLRIMGLAEMAYQFATEVLAPGGHFICKLFQGGAEKDLLAQMKKDFTSVRHAKPAASRQDSSETYLVAMGFRGGVAAQPADDGQD